MDKLKKVFSPGSSKDDEVLYGDAEARRASAGKQPEREAETLHTTEESQKKDHSILRQILNPGGDKHDDQRFGTTATTEGPDPNKLQTDSDQKEHSVMRQLVNPAGDKYDEQAFGTTAATAGDRKDSVPTTQSAGVDPNEKLETDKGQKDHSILRQILNPHGKKYDEEGYGTTAHEAQDDSGKPLPLMRPDQNLVSDKEAESSSRAEPSQNQAAQSRLGRDAAIASGAGVAGGGAAYAATRDRDEPGRSNMTSGGTSSLQDKVGREVGYDQSAQTASATAPAQSNTTSQPAAYTAIARENPSATGTGTTVGREFGYDRNAPEATATAPATSSSAGQPAALSAIGQNDPNTSTDNSHLGRDAAIAGGVGALGAGGAYAATRDRDHGNEPSSVQTSESTRDTLRNDQGLGSERNIGREGVIAGTDPSTVGSGFLGSNTHGQHGTSATGTSSTLDAKPQTDGLADGRSAERAANEQSGQHNYGRDATLASGVAAGGVLGSHELNKHHDQQNERGDNFIAATGTAPVSRPLDGDSNIATGRVVERSGTSSLPDEASRLESGAGSGITGSSINPIGAPETGYAGAGHLGSSGTPAGSGFTEQSGSGSTGLGSAAATTGAIGGIQASNAPGHGHINPVGAPEDRLAGAHHHGVVGSGVHNDTGSEQLNQAPADVQAATYTYSTQHVGGSDRPFLPHIPGEFPTETGEDPHETSRSYGTTAGEAQNVPLAGTTGLGHTTPSAQTGTTSDRKDYSQGKAAALGAGTGLAGGLVASDLSSRTTQPQQSSSIPPTGTSASTSQNYPLQSTTNQMATPITPATVPEVSANDGRDAAIAGGALGAGAVGAGAAAEATRGAQVATPATVAPTPDPVLASKTVKPVDTPATTAPVAPSPATQTLQETPLKKDNNLGKDAAVVGGAGAVGAGAATADKVDTGPAPKTIGPHDSDVKNVLDPKVQPDPAVQGSKKADATAEAPEDHSTRDAALATGAAGTGAAAAYGTTHDVYGQEDPNKHNKLHKPTPDEKKHDKEMEKEHKKADKAAEKEHHKQEKQAEKDHKKAEKEAEKEHHKQEKQAEKDQKKAEKEAEKAKKPSLIDKILHPGRHDGKEKEYVQNEKTGQNKGDLNHPLVGAAEAEQAERQAHNLPPKDPAAPSSSNLDGTNEGVVIEPHTGLPMNVGKYGVGSGGTDGAQQIEGYHERDSAVQHATVGTGQGAGTKAGHAQPGQEGVAGPDWDAIKKANTPY